MNDIARSVELRAALLWQYIEVHDAELREDDDGYCRAARALLFHGCRTLVLNVIMNDAAMAAGLHGACPIFFSFLLYLSSFLRHSALRSTVLGKHRN